MFVTLLKRRKTSVHVFKSFNVVNFSVKLPKFSVSRFGLVCSFPFIYKYINKCYVVETIKYEKGLQVSRAERGS